MASPHLGNGLTAAGLTNTSSNVVADYLKSPDDLTKIAALRKKLLKEQASISAKLKTGAKDQLEATRDGLLKLQATRKDVATIRESFGEVDTLCGENGNEVASSNGSIKSFRVISEVSQIHRNFVQTASILEKLLSLPHQIESLAILLEELQSDLFNPNPDLLAAHFHISQLETFRNETLQLGRSCSMEVRETLQEYFAPLDGLIKGFEKYLMAICSRIMDLVREGRSNVVILILKIIEKESREDEKAAAIRLAKKANLEGAARFQSVIANARVIKLYRPKLMESMDGSNKELFEECWQRFGTTDTGREDPSAFLDHLDWVYKDLAFVKEEMESLFPQDYNIYRFFVKSYHKQLGSILKTKILDTDPEASVLLTLYQYSQEYKKTMTKELQVTAQWLEPSLLGGKEQSIIDDYLSLITKKIDEWTANLMSDEIREFVSRENPPDESSEGLYGLQYASILFQMVNQQIEVAADSGQANILVRATSHACSAMGSSQATWLRILEQEFRKQREAKSPQEVTEGLVEYVIALANDQLKSADYAEVFQNKVEAMVSAKYKGQVKEAVDNAINGYLDVTKRCTQVLVDLVFADLRPVLRELFVFPAWYSEGIMTTIVETIRDYTSDYSERLNPNLFDVLCDDLIDRFLLAYLGCLRRTTKLRMPAAGEKMKSDMEECKVVFAAFKTPEELIDKFQVMEMILAMLTSSATMVFLSYWTFAKSHGSQLAFLESIMKARDDLDKGDVTAIMESAKRKVKQENLAEVPEGGITVVGRVEAAHNSGGLFAISKLVMNKANMNSEGAQGGGAAWSALAARANFLGQGWRGGNNESNGSVPPPIDSSVSAS